MEAKTNLWEQLPNEPVDWYARFTAYRLLGAQRSLLAAVNQEREKEHKGPLKSAPTAWKEAATKYEWKSRAEAWDLFNLANDEQAEEKARLEARLTRRRLFTAFEKKLSEMIENLDTTNPKASDVTAALKLFSEGMRLEHNDVPASKSEVSGPDGSELIIKVRYGNENETEDNAADQ